MKRLLTLSLVLLLLWEPIHFTPRAQAQSAPALLVIATMVIAGALVFYVYHADHYTQKMRTLCLYVSHYDGNWTPVITNTVFVSANLALAFPAFRAYMTDDTAIYKIMEVTPPPGWTPQQTPLFSKYQLP